jgi:hypothetical protein
MTLKELGAELKDIEQGKVLTFWCPKCTGDIAHKHRIPISPYEYKGNKWQLSGDFPEITLIPSYNGGCIHVNIIKGELK